MTPYFEKNGVTLFHADCREVLPTLPEKSAGLVLTDPPYSEETHKGARTGSNGNEVLIHFAPLPDPVELFGIIGRVAARWVVATMEWRHVADLERLPPDGLRFVRVGAWVKPDPVPQISGDRPGQGFEAVAVMHRAQEGYLRWNGGGLPAVWTYGIEKNNSEYPTQKPLPLVQKLISQFADPYDLVLDPFSGGGTTLVAAYRMGHRAIGCDISERACEVAAKRLEREMAQGSLFKRGVA